jgi:hypothetical protein
MPRICGAFFAGMLKNQLLLLLFQQLFDILYR